MPWRVIALGDQVWHVDALAERPADTDAWQLVLSFRAAAGGQGVGAGAGKRAFWTPYPLEAASKSSWVSSHRTREQRAGHGSQMSFRIK